MADVPLREFVETIVKEHDRRHNALRTADQQALEQYKLDTQRALDVAKSNADRMIAMIFSLLALIISVATAAFVYHSGVK